MQRTMRVLLEPSVAQAATLADTGAQFTSAFNQAVEIGWRERITNATKLHYAAYYPVKAAHPTLVADHINQARIKAAEALRSAFTLQRHGRKVRQPVSTDCPVRLNKNTYIVDWESRTVRMSTTGGRQTVRFRVPPYFDRYAGYPMDTADLINRDGHWWLHIVVTVPAPEVPANDTVVGVDLGLAQPAVTSNNRFLGQQRWRAREARLFKLKRALQKKSTKSAKRHLKRVRRTQARFRRDCDHVLSKQIAAATPPGGTIVLENLKDIRRRVKPRHGAQARRLHGWSFAQLKQFVTYKAEARGCTVVSVDPRHTSQTCSRCGHQARNNRRARGWFRCRACDFQLHADANASRNIAAKYRASLSMPEGGGQPVNLPTVGGSESLSHDSTHKLPALASSR